jgi:DNA-directed RNA polymerase subunit RPC12/RpoP
MVARVYRAYVCTHCKTEYMTLEELLSHWGLDDVEEDEDKFN